MSDEGLNDEINRFKMGNNAINEMIIKLMFAIQTKRE
jgi:hypothetical protein